MTRTELLRTGEGPVRDWLRGMVQQRVQEVMDAEVRDLVRAGRYERSELRTPQRNGVRHRPWDTRLGTLDLAIPKLRVGSSVPTWLEPRRRAEQALVTVVAGGEYPQGGSVSAGARHQRHE